MPDSIQPNGLYFFLETVPGDSLAESRAYLTQVNTWLAFDSSGRPIGASGGGRTLSVRPGAGDSEENPTTEAFVASEDRLPGLPLTWGQIFAGSPEEPGGDGTRDISRWLRWVDVEPLPAGCKVRPAPDGLVEVLYPDGSLMTIYPPAAE